MLQRRHHSAISESSFHRVGVRADSNQQDRPALLAEEACRSIAVSASQLEADLIGLPLDREQRYLAIWPRSRGRRHQQILHAEGPVEAAATFAVSLGWLRPRFYGRTGEVLYCRAEDTLFYVLAASTPVASAVSRYLMRATDLIPGRHGGFKVARPSALYDKVRPSVIELRLVAKINGRPCLYEHHAVAVTNDEGMAEQIAEILNADLRLGEGT